MRIEPDINKQLALIKRGAVELYSEEELRKKLERSIAKGQPLVVKAGFDPTAPDLHLGHTVLLRKLRQFQDLGHKVVFLIGDFTGMIGDPSGRSEKRKQLTKEEVAENAKSYVGQVSKVLDTSGIDVVCNSSWFERMSVADILRLTSRATVAQILARSDFKKRMSSGDDVSLLEFMYPLLQAYDSVMLNADVEIGGTDQVFNLLFGRDLQIDFKQEPQVVLTMPLLEGTDGVQKMSKSYGNYIGINESARDIFGKVMSVSDDLMMKYYELLTEEDLDGIRAMHPKDAKTRLGELIVSAYHGADAGARAHEEFERVFSQKELPEDIREFACAAGQDILSVMVKSGLVKSGNEGRRLLQQGAVSFNDRKINDESFAVKESGILKVGSRRFLRISC